MDAVRRAVLQKRLESDDDETLITELNKLVPEFGQKVFQCIFYIFTGHELSPQTAQEYWLDTLLHRKRMSEALGRPIDLLPCMYDFLETTDHPLRHPRLLEEQSYNKVITETIHDSLTSLFNRNYFNTVLEQTVSTSLRYHTDCTLLFLDIDNFKEINDTHGHEAGDSFLQNISQIIQLEKRDSDIAARYGGEEFVLLMPHTNILNGFILAERIRKSVENLKVTHNGEDIHTTLSGGIAACPQYAKTPPELLNRADSALYLAKGSGKNTISMFRTEKRRYLRVKYSEPIQIKELGFGSPEIYSGTSKDIGIGGILFENDKPFRLGSRIEVSIPMQGKTPVLLIGTVVRVEAYGEKSYDIGMAISFKEMEKIASKEIANYLQSTV